MGLIAKLVELGLLIIEETGEWTSQGEREGPTAQSDVSEGEAYLIFVTNPTNISVEKKFVMWRNFRFQYVTDVENSEISPHVE